MKKKINTSECIINGQSDSFIIVLRNCLMQMDGIYIEYVYKIKRLLLKFS